jgi:FeS assembly protein SufD
MAGSATRPRDSGPDEFLTAALDRSSRGPRSPVLAMLRNRARSAIEAGLPQGKLETFKYTPIVRFYRPELLNAITDAIRIEANPSGIDVRSFSDDASTARPLDQLDRHVDHARHPLAHLNAGLIDGGRVVHVKRNARITEPVRIDYPATTSGAALTRLLLVVDEHAEVTFIESDLEEGVANRVCELVVGPHAKVTHVRVQRRTRGTSWSLASVDVGRNAKYTHRLYAAAANPRRNDLHVRLIGEHADIDLKGAFIADDAGTLDNQIVVEHAATHGTSRHRFHGVAARRGELTFNGRIHIHPGAAGADAELRTASLLIDATSRINSKPELEIYNDDVKCAHGATVGQLDPAALFYLRSRGLPEPNARHLLLQAFVAQCIDLPHAADAARALFDGVFS